MEKVTGALYTEKKQRSGEDVKANNAEAVVDFCSFPPALTSAGRNLGDCWTEMRTGNAARLSAFDNPGLGVAPDKSLQGLRIAPAESVKRVFSPMLD